MQSAIQPLSVISRSIFADDGCVGRRRTCPVMASASAATISAYRTNIHGATFGSCKTISGAHKCAVSRLLGVGKVLCHALLERGAEQTATRERSEQLRLSAISWRNLGYSV